MADKVQKIREEVERQKNLLTYIKSLQEDTVSEELEEAANKYIKGNYSPWLYKAMFDCFKAGAKWQKEQMMKDAIEIEGGELHLNYANAIISKGTAPFEKCKVKMIIIKED